MTIGMSRPNARMLLLPLLISFGLVAQNGWAVHAIEHGRGSLGSPGVGANAANGRRGQSNEIPLLHSSLRRLQDPITTAVPGEEEPTVEETVEELVENVEQIVDALVEGSTAPTDAVNELMEVVGEVVEEVNEEETATSQPSTAPTDADDIIDETPADEEPEATITTTEAPATTEAPEEVTIPAAGETTEPATVDNSTEASEGDTTEATEPASTEAPGDNNVTSTELPLTTPAPGEPAATTTPIPDGDTSTSSPSSSPSSAPTVSGEEDEGEPETFTDAPTPKPTSDWYKDEESQPPVPTYEPTPWNEDENEWGEWGEGTPWAPEGPTDPPTPRPTFKYVPKEGDDYLAQEEEADVEDFADDVFYHGLGGKVGGYLDGVESPQELERDPNVQVIAGILVSLFLVLLLLTAHFVMNHPDGLCAGCCRLVLKVICCFTRTLCLPCRAICCKGSDQSHSRRTHAPMRTPFPTDLELA